MIVLSTYFNIDNLVSSALVFTISSISSSNVTDLTQCNVISPVIDAYIDITLIYAIKKYLISLILFILVYLDQFLWTVEHCS